MRILIPLIFIFILIIPLTQAAKISELKPKGVEWVEIFNENKETLNLSLWTIQDNSTDHPDTLSCENISGCSLETDAEFFLVLGRSAKIGDITSENVIYFYTDDQKIGNGLNDNGDIITIKENNETLDSMTYGIIGNANFSFQLVDGEFCENIPTPGKGNKCQEPIIEENTTSNETQTNQTQQTVDNETIQNNQTAQIIPSNSTNTTENNAVSTKKDSSAKKTFAPYAKSNASLNSSANSSSNESPKKVIYQSKNETMKEASIYLLGGLLLILIVYAATRFKTLDNQKNKRYF